MEPVGNWVQKKNGYKEKFYIKLTWLLLDHTYIQDLTMQQNKHLRAVVNKLANKEDKWRETATFTSTTDWWRKNSCFIHSTAWKQRIFSEHCSNT